MILAIAACLLIGACGSTPEVTPEAAPEVAEESVMEFEQRAEAMRHVRESLEAVYAEMEQPRLMFIESECGLIDIATNIPAIASELEKLDQIERMILARFICGKLESVAHLLDFEEFINFVMVEVLKVTADLPFPY